MELGVYLALGARDGDAVRQLRDGIARLGMSGVHAVTLSRLWETEPVGIPEGRPVLNAAGLFSTSLQPRALLAACQEAEASAGRRRSLPEWRSLDLDILLAGDLVVEEPDLVIPHPRFHTRRFNLAPLAEIAPGVLHPLFVKSISSLLLECADPAWARPIPGDWLPSAFRTGRTVSESR